jgi:acetolactate synthase-1/2/3 large subunit
VFAADATSRLTGIPGVAAVTAGPGITNTLTALKNAQQAQSPLVLIGGAAPTALQGRGALQDIDQRPLVAPHVKRFFKVRRVADLGPAVAQAFALARSGVPGPVFVECPVDLLYDEASIRQWYADAAGKGTSIADRALRWYLQRHVRKMFAGSDQATAAPLRDAAAPQAPTSALARVGAALARAERPLLVVGSQAVVMSQQADALAVAVERLGVPVYLSGMARGLLGREHPLQLRHQRRQAPRGPTVCCWPACLHSRLDYGRHCGAAPHWWRARVRDLANRPRGRHRRRGLSLQALAAGRWPRCAHWADWLAGCVRDEARSRGRSAGGRARRVREPGGAAARGRAGDERRRLAGGRWR